MQPKCAVASARVTFPSDRKLVARWFWIIPLARACGCVRCEVVNLRDGLREVFNLVDDPQLGLAFAQRFRGSAHQRSAHRASNCVSALICASSAEDVSTV